MAIAFVATGPSGVGTSQTSTFQSGVATFVAGDVLVIGISINPSTISISAVTTTVGDTAVFQGAITSGNVRTELWAIASTVGGSCRINLTFTGTATDISVISGVYSGVVALGNVTTASGSTVNNLTQSLTTQDTNNFIVGVFGSDGTSTWNSSFNIGTFRQRLSQSGAESCFGDNTVASPGSVSVKSTVGGGTPNVTGVAIELRTSSGGGTTYNQTVGPAGLTPSGSLGTVSMFNEVLTGAGLTPSGSIKKLVSKLLTAAGLMPTGGLVKKANKVLTSASLTPSGSMVTSFLYKQALAGTLTFIGALTAVKSAGSTAISWLSVSLRGSTKRGGY